MKSASEKKYRVAMVGGCPYPVGQGSQVLLGDTARALHARGHEVHLIVYGYGEGETKEPFAVHRTRVLPGPKRTAAGPGCLKLAYDWLLAREIRRVVRDHNIDIIHAHNYEGLIAALWSGERPVVYHAHNVMADELPYFSRVPFLPGIFGRWLDRRYPKRATAIIALHQTMKAYLINAGCEAARVHVVPPGTDLDEFNATAPTAGPPFVLYTGNLDRYQNLPLLYRAMEHVRKKMPEAVLVIATNRDVPLPRAERVLVRSFQDLREILQKDCIVACPRVAWSGYPIKLVNAMAAGRPIVACASAAHGILGEKTCVVVWDNDATNFGDALLRLLSDPDLRLTFGTAARHLAETYHSLDRYGAMLEGVYAPLGGGPFGREPS